MLAEPVPSSRMPLDAEIDGLIAEFHGDLRAVIAALLHDLTVLAQDAEQNTSRGYVRSKVVRLRHRNLR